MEIIRDNLSFLLIDSWVTVRKATPYTPEFQKPLKGTVRTPTVASGRGNYLRTAYLRSQRDRSSLLQRHQVLVTPRCLMLWFHRRALCREPQISRDKSRVMEPYCERHKFPTVTYYLQGYNCVHTPVDEYPRVFEDDAGTPAVPSGRGRRESRRPLDI